MNCSSKFILFVAALASASAFGAPGGRMRPRDLPECQAPYASCIKAGFKVGVHKPGDPEGADNGLWVDCVGAAADKKKTIAGLDADSAAKCRDAAKALRQQNRK